MIIKNKLPTQQLLSNLQNSLSKIKLELIRLHEKISLLKIYSALLHIKK